MLVYRVENDKGLGPYMWGEDQFTKRYGMMVAHSNNEHRSPYGDKKLRYISGHEYCGLNSIRACLKWFDTFHEDLEWEGFHVTIYDAPEARVGQFGQTLFDRDSATKIKRVPLTKLRRAYRQARAQHKKILI